MPSWLGDFVMAEPTLAGLDLARLDGRFRRLTVCGPERFFDLLQDRFEGVERVEPTGDWSGHDVALFLDGSARSLWRALRAGVGTRVSWSSGGRAWLASESYLPALEGGATPVGLGTHGRGLRRLPRPFGSTCAELAGLLGVPVVERAPRLGAAVAALRSVRSRLAEVGLGANPYLFLDGSARLDSAKAAPAELWVEVIEGLREAGAPPVVIASAPGEDALAREIQQALGEGGGFFFNAPPPTLGELLALIQGSRLFLGTDSGPRHLAVASATPAVILCGPTDPRHTADHNEAVVVIRREIECGPCHRERCPLGDGPARGACLGELRPGAIVQAVLDQLRATRAG